MYASSRFPTSARARTKGAGPQAETARPRTIDEICESLRVSKRDYAGDLFAIQQGR